MKRRLVLLGFVLILLIACEGDKRRPVQVVEAFMAAIERFDIPAAERLVCEAQRSAVRESLQPFGDVAQVEETFDLAFEDLTFQELSNDGDRAVVQVNGTLHLVFLGQQDTQSIQESHVVIKEQGRWVVCDP